MKNTFYAFLIASLLINCRSESTEESSSTETETSTQSSSTLVKMNVLNSQNMAQKDIVVMMFKSKITSVNNLPTIEKQATSDISGLATLDLSSYITSNIATTYYFEAFKKDGNNYIWVSKTHPEISIKKGQQTTTSIVVN